MNFVHSKIHQLPANLTKLAYSRTEAAKLLGINPITLDRLAKRGLIHPSRAIRRPLYAHTELIRFLEETKSLDL